jgi:hypothetical protein
MTKGPEVCGGDTVNLSKEDNHNVQWMNVKSEHYSIEQYGLKATKNLSKYISARRRRSEGRE